MKILNIKYFKIHASILYIIYKIVYNFGAYIEPLSKKILTSNISEIDRSIILIKELSEKISLGVK